MRGPTSLHFVSFSVALSSFWNLYQPLANFKGLDLKFPLMQRGGLMTKKEGFYLPFTVRFTVKVLILIDTFLKCWAKLKLNTWVRPSRFKDPANGQDGTDEQTDLTVSFFYNLSKCRNELYMYMLSTWGPHLHWMMLFTYAFRRNSKNGRKFILGLCWLLERLAPTFLAPW